MLMILFIAVSCRITNLIDGSQMEDLIKMVGIAFMGCNSVEHICTAVKEWTTTTSGGDDGGTQ